jgi:hypothetical protein
LTLEFVVQKKGEKEKENHYGRGVCFCHRGALPSFFIFFPLFFTLFIEVSSTCATINNHNINKRNKWGGSSRRINGGRNWAPSPSLLCVEELCIFFKPQGLAHLEVRVFWTRLGMMRFGGSIQMSLFILFYFSKPRGYFCFTYIKIMIWWSHKFFGQVGAYGWICHCITSFSTIIYGVVLAWFLHHQNFQETIMHVQMCTSFRNKIFWKLEVNFLLIFWKFTYHLYRGSVNDMKNHKNKG